MESFLQKYFDLSTINTSFSFAPYYQFLQRRIKGTDDVKRKMLVYFASRIEAAGVQDKDIAPAELEQYKDLLELVYVSLTDISLDPDKDIWGITAPFMSTFAYGTPVLYQFFVDKNTGWMKKEYVSNLKEIGVVALKNIYQAILYKLYQISYTSHEEFVYRYLDKNTGLYRFFKVHVNHDFIDVKFNRVLPELSEQMITGMTESDDFLRYMSKTLPLTDFIFRGFGIVTISDITHQQSLTHIKERLWKLRNDDSCGPSIFEDLQISVRSLLGTNKINIGAMPFILLNNKLVRNAGEGLLSNTLLEEKEIQTFFREFENSGRPIVIENVNELPIRSLFVAKMLSNTPYLTYAALPIFYQQKVYGVIELFSSEPGIITPERVKLLENLYVELAQLMKMGHEIFEHSIREVISDRFTVIQPSVAWKFNETALAYLDQEHTHGKVIQKVPIVFQSVFPLYGAVDIRHSSLIRNNAIRADWQLQLQWLLKTANELASFALPKVHELITQQMGFLEANKIDQPISSETISRSNALDKELRQQLIYAAQEQPEIAGTCHAYLAAIDTENGACSINRRNLDVSMQQAIAGIDVLLDEMNSKMQEIFPAYYNKFRTDGIEYDLYVGQSMNPELPFDHNHLHQLHATQLDYMRKVALANAAQQHALLVPLQATQLIFVNTDVIDITFREDEKRFDVEGAYNIRYQMIKKRIDKVHLRNAEERLTQPGKIAIVYINEQDVKDYVSLLEEQIMKKELSNLEHLELEDLQGISGLKALRVTVEGV